MSDETALHIAARDIPVPAHLSPQAQAWLAMPRGPRAGYPAIDDSAGWRAHVAAMDAMVSQMYFNRPLPVPCTVTERREGDARGG